MERTASGKEIISTTKSGLNILKDSDCVGNDYGTEKPKTYLIELKSCGNPDFGQDPDREMSPCMLIDFKTIEEAQNIQSDYLGEYDLGGGNWCGGNITHMGKIVARMSFNGRVWESTTGVYSSDDKELKELI
jgi:hypothetical protein